MVDPKRRSGKSAAWVSFNLKPGVALGDAVKATDATAAKIEVQHLNEIYTFLEILLLRTGALALLGIFIYKQTRKHWLDP